MNNFITAFFGNKLVNKSFVRENNVLVKTELQNSFFTGTALKIPCNSLDQLKRILEIYANNDNFCLSLGYHEQAEPNQVYHVVKNDLLSADGMMKMGLPVVKDYVDGDDFVDPNGVLVTARLKRKMKQSNFTLFDYDSKGNDMTYEAWTQAVSDVIPQFKTCGKVITASNSARVGYEMSNFHVYTMLDRTNGLLEFGKNLGSHLEGLLDTSTFSRERVIYEGCPCIIGELTPPPQIRIEGDGSVLELTAIIPKAGSRKDQFDKGLTTAVLDDTGIDLFQKIKLDDRTEASLYEMRDQIKLLEQNHASGSSSSDSHIRCWVTHLRPESKSRNGKIWNYEGLPILRDYNDQGVTVNYTIGTNDELSKLIWWFDYTGNAINSFNETQELNLKNRKILDDYEEDMQNSIRKAKGIEPDEPSDSGGDYIDEDDKFIPIRLGSSTFYVPKIIDNEQFGTLDRLNNLGCNYDVCRVIINRVYKIKSKLYVVDEAGGFNEQPKDIIQDVVVCLYGFPVEDFDPTDKADKERVNTIFKVLFSYIFSYNNFKDDEISVDMFSDHFKLDSHLDEFGMKILSTKYPYRPKSPPPLLNPDAYDAIMKDYVEHYPAIHRVLDFIVYSRFASNSRTSMMWFKAQSGWGKSLLFENLEKMGIMFRFQNYDKFLKVISGSPFGIDKGAYLTSLGFFVDEFDRVTKELKSIDSKIDINPKNDRPFSLDTYSKIFVSHQEVTGLSGGVDTELGNRFVYETPDSRDLISDRVLFNKDRDGYNDSLRHWLVVEVNKRVNELVGMGRRESEAFASNQLALYFEEHNLERKLGSLDEDVDLVVDEIRYKLTRMWEYRFSLETSISNAPDDKKLIEMFHTRIVKSTPVNGEYEKCIFVKALDSFLLEYLHHYYRYDKGLLLSLKRRRKEIKELLVKDHKTVRFDSKDRHTVSIIELL